MNKQGNIFVAFMFLFVVVAIGIIIIAALLGQASTTEEPAQIGKIQPVAIGAEFLADPDNIEHAKGVAEVNVMNSEANLNNGMSNAAEDVGSAVETFAFGFLVDRIGSIFIGILAVVGIIAGLKAAMSDGGYQ